MVGQRDLRSESADSTGAEQRPQAAESMDSGTGSTSRALGQEGGRSPEQGDCQSCEAQNQGTEALLLHRNDVLLLLGTLG